MRSSFWLTTIVLASAAVVAAQSASGAAAIANKFDTPQARVYIATLQPHVPVPSRSGHATNRVLIYMDDGVMTRQDSDGKVQQLAFHRGDIRWRPASGPYIAENVSDHPVRLLEIDLKGKPAGPAPATKLDPTVVDAAHYKVALENDQVRVIRVHYGAREKGAEHEHILNRVVLVLNDQPGGKTDDVRMAGAVVHAEQNESDQPADRIAVELK